MEAAQESKNANTSNLIFAFLSVVLLLASALWIKQSDFLPAYTGDTRFFALAHDYINLIKEDLNNLASYALRIHDKKPPLIIYIFTLVIGIFQNHSWTFMIGILLINLFFLYSLFQFFKYVFDNNRVARNYTLLLYMVSPLLFGITKLAYVETLLLSLLLLTWALIKKWAGGFNTPRAVLLGLVVALGFYTKSTYVIYIILPFFYLMSNEFYVLRQIGNSSGHEEQKSVLLLNNIPAFLLGFSVCLPWYIRNIKRVFNLFSKAADYNLHSDGETWAFATIGHYAFDLIQALGIFSFALLVLLTILGFSYIVDMIKPFLPKAFCLIACTANWIKESNRSFLFSVYFVPLATFVAFFFVNNKNERFQSIAIFLILVFIAFLLTKVSSSALKTVALVLIASQGLYNYHLSFAKLNTKFPDTSVVYVSRPYPKLFPDELAEAILNFSDLSKVNFLDMREQGNEDFIYSNNSKSIMTSNPHFALYKAQRGVVALQDVRSSYRQASNDIIRSQKDYILVLYDYNQTMTRRLNFGANSGEQLMYKFEDILSLDDIDHKWVLYKKMRLEE